MKIDIEKYHCPPGYALLLLDGVMPPKTPGGLEIPEDARIIAAHNQLDGLLVQIGKDAFNDTDIKPKLGDRIVYRKFKGVHFIGKDEYFYHLISTALVNDVYLGFVPQENPN
ncbi:MAG: hypothetical protein ULS35scaffold63_14 [Phage 33_17]|nr:MAG: hypothetical protein ULS35scaffold63_14 [Phage 33_17]